MSRLLHSKTQGTYDQIFQHPLTHNLDWHDTKRLFEALGEVEEEHNGNLKVTLGGHTRIFQGSSDGKIASAADVMQIRHFLEEAYPKKGSGERPHILVVIDSAEAKIYRLEMKDSVPEKVLMDDPHGYNAHVHNSHDYLTHIEDRNLGVYFKLVAEKVKDAEQILVFGSGSGNSGVKDEFMAWLGEHAPHVRSRVLAAVIIDQGHLTEGQLLAKAREYYNPHRP